MKENSVKKRAALAAAGIGLVFLISCIALVLMQKPAETGAQVCIYQNGELLERHPLREDGEYRIETGDGEYNVVSIRDGQVSVSEASCKNQLCVRMGAIHSSAVPIVCLPNQLVVQIEGMEDEVDGVAR